MLAGYVVGLFIGQLLAVVFYLGKGEEPETAPFPVRFLLKWLLFLPLVGRVFGWW